MQALNKKILLFAVATLLFAFPGIATASVVSGTGYNVNIGLYTLVGLMFLLLFVIGMLAYTLAQLSMVVKEKNRKEREESKTTKSLPLLLILIVLMPFHAFAADSGPWVFPKTIDDIPFDDFCLIMTIISLELLVIFTLATYIRVLIKVIKGEAETIAKHDVVIKKKSWFWDKFNNAATEEKEQEILLDHNYDGIQELDNSLPPWWKYGFYLTIVVAVIYLYRFHISHDGQSQQDEYLAEMQQGEEDKAAYLAKSANNVDETNVTQLTEGMALASGKELFDKNCVACHLADGGGSVGPNLTDSYWLHGGGLKDIFKSIKYGWQDKGMKSWKDDLSPSQIQQVASFIRSLKDSHPAVPKAPQGDLYVEVTESVQLPKTDSARIVE